MKKILITLLLSIIMISCADKSKHAKKNVDTTEIESAEVTTSNKPTTPTTLVKSEEKEETKEEAKDTLNRELLTATKIARYLKLGQKDSLGLLFSYPITRGYPMKDIQNETEFIKRYAELFDDKLTDRLINNLYEWSSAGWRGIIFGDNCDVMVDGDYGKIYQFNYETNYCNKLRIKTIKDEYSTLHPDVTRYIEAPYASFKTKDGEWYGRIDYTTIESEDNASFQLSLYKSSTPLSDKPDYIVLGDKHIEGSACNAYYFFSGTSVSFSIDILEVYSSSVYPYTLTIHQEPFLNSKDPDTSTQHNFEFIYWLDVVK